MKNISQILLVDDDVALLQAFPQALFLRIDEVQIDTCDSALEALEQIQEHDYDAIVSDIKMPGMDGWALLAKIQELRPETPTLLITGHGEHDLAIQALRGGAYDYIQKPIDRDYVVAAVHRAIQTHQLRRQVREHQRALELHAQSLERVVQNRTQELVQANAVKDKFLSMVSHELRTPLTSLKGRAQLLRRQLERADVDDIHLIEEYTAGSGPTLRFEAPGEPIEAEVDPDRISQVMLNLMSNARKYSPKGYPITVTLQQAGYEAIISVRDMGVGIPAEMLPHIFDQYYSAQGVEVQTGSHTGLGLGLYISRKLVERHAGHIDVQSVPGGGNVFSVVLPLFVDPTTENVDAAKLVPHTQAVWTIAH